MSTSDPHGGDPPAQPTATDAAAAGEAAAGEPEAPKKRRNPWIGISALLAVIAVGLFVWALSTKSDLDDTQKEVDDLHAQVEQGQQTGSSFVAAAKTAFQDLTEQLGATSEDLEAAEQDISDAESTADQAQKDADAAKQASNATDKAKAEADQAKAEAKAPESKATIAADCAKAYMSAIGSLFEGEDARAQASKVGDQMNAITSDCQTALGGT